MRQSLTPVLEDAICRAGTPSSRKRPLATGLQAQGMRLARGIARLIGDLVVSYRNHRAEAALAELPDHLLRDIGIPRGQIPHVVRYGRSPGAEYDTGSGSGTRPAQDGSKECAS